MSGTFSSILDLIIPSRKREKKYRNNSNRLEAFLRALPYEYCGWNVAGVQALSSGFKGLFDLERIRTIEDIQDALEPGDGAALETLYDNLHEYGHSFDITVSIGATGKILRLTGQRGSLSDGEEVFNVIWVFDITEYANKIQNTLKTLENIELREQEFNTALNALPMPVWMRNSDLNLTWVNKKYSEIVGESFATIIGEQIELPLKHSDEDPRSLKIIAQRAIAQQRVQNHSSSLTAGGKRMRVDIIVMPNADKGTIGCAVDISRIGDLESELQHLQTSNYEVLEQLRTGIAIFDANTRLDFYNGAYEELWGLEGKWLNNKPKITEILDKLRENRKTPEQANFKQYKDEWVEKFKNLIEPEETILYLPDQTMLRMVVIPRPRGGLLVTYEDVTSNIELESSYNTLLAVQKETIDNLAEGLAVIGEDGQIKLYNPTFFKLWDITPPQGKIKARVNEFFDKLKPLFNEKEWLERRDELIKSCFNRDGKEGRISLKDGRIYAYRTVALPDGNVLITFTNITDTMKVEQALIEKNAALEAAEKLKMDFLANVSYQLRTPLNAMMGFTEILHEEYFGSLNDRQKSYTENMIRAGHRLITLVDNILDLSTIEAGYLILNRENIDIKDTIENVIELTQDWARREGIEIETQVPKNIGSLLADERRFKQVMLHLIRNAIDYTPSGGLIKVRAKKEKNETLITIQDSGVGIPKADLEKIFVPFEKSQTQNKKNGQANRHSGAGLGLSLVKHIVELHGGSIEIKSIEKKGTTVTCRYPLSANENTENH